MEEIDLVETIVAWLNDIGYTTHKNFGYNNEISLFWGEHDTEAKINIYRYRTGEADEIYLYTHHTHLSMVVQAYDKEEFGRLVRFLEAYARSFKIYGGNVVPGNFRI